MLKKLDPPNIPLPQLSIKVDGMVTYILVNEKVVSSELMLESGQKILTDILHKIQWEMEELAKKSSAREHTQKLRNISNR